MKMRKIEMGFTEPDMTPMIDIVFQLLTFFMIAINFENTKADERVKLPKDTLAKPPVVKPEHELVLNFGYQRTATGERAKPFPEIFYNEKVDEKCDVWSLGIIFYELIYKTLPWNGKSAIDLFRNNISKKKISFPKGADDDSETQDLISKMLQTDKNKRISIQEVLEHEALQRKTQKKIIKK